MASWAFSLTVIGSGLIGAAIGWQSKSGPVRTQNIIFQIISAFIVFFTVRCLSHAVSFFRNRYFMTPEKTTVIVNEAIAKGLLPETYQRERDRDRKIAKTIYYDRRIGLTEQEIKKDLENIHS